MNEAEWNKKEELVGEQALKHLKAYTPLFAAFTSIAKSELCLMLRVQEYCYGNMNFMKVFSKIIMLFYKSKLKTPAFPRCEFPYLNEPFYVEDFSLAYFGVASKVLDL
jgi:hypothetical protein